MAVETSMIFSDTLFGLPKEITPAPYKQNPHELHWRKEPPQPWGNLDHAYKRYYPHMIDRTHCRQCGAVPCPFDHEGEKRMRLKDLEFIKELAQERKELRAENERITERMLKMKEKMNSWQSEKTLLLQQVDFFKKLKKEWISERCTLEAEIYRLRSLNTEQQEMLVNYRKDQKKIKLLEKQVADMRKQNEKLEADKRQLRQMVINLNDDMQKLSAENDKKEKALEGAHTEIKILKVTVDEAYEDLALKDKEMVVKDDKINALKADINKMMNQLKELSQLFQIKETEHSNIVQFLKDQINGLKSAMRESEKKCENLQEQIRIYIIQIEKLKLKLINSSKFKQFVEVKRENIDLKEKNETLAVIVDEVTPVIPSLRKTGRVEVAKSRVKSALPLSVTVQSKDFQQSKEFQRLLPSRKGRPKSAVRTLSHDSFTDLYSEQKNDVKFLQTLSPRKDRPKTAVKLYAKDSFNENENLKIETFS